MGASPATSSLSVSYSLPSTPIFPPLIHPPSQGNGPEAQKEVVQLRGKRKPVECHGASVAQEKTEETIRSAETLQQPRVQQETKQDDEVQETRSTIRADNPSANRTSQRGAAALRLGSADVPSSLLRPLDQEEERKALRLEQQFRKERMAALRRQNELRRRRHAEKQQQLRAAAVRERAVALENRHKKLQAARVLMERGFSSAAVSAPTGPSTAVKHTDAATATAVAPGPSSPPCGTGLVSNPIPPASSEVGHHLAEPSSCGPTACTVQPRPKVPASLHSRSACQATSNQALLKAPSTYTVEHPNTRHNCAADHTSRSSSETVADSRTKDPQPAHVTTSVPPDNATGNIFLGAAAAGYTCFPNVSTIAKCFVAGAAMGCEGAVRTTRRCSAAGRYQCHATQEILSLWPYEHPTRLNASVNKQEQLVLFKKHNVDRLLLAASISSDETPGQTGSTWDRGPVGGCIGLRRANLDCNTLPAGPAFPVRRPLPAAPPMLCSTSRSNQPFPRLDSSFTSGQTPGRRKQLLNRGETAQQIQEQQQTRQHQEQRAPHELQERSLQQQRHRKGVRQQCQLPSSLQISEQHTLSAAQQHSLEQLHQPVHPRGRFAQCLPDLTEINSDAFRCCAQHYGSADLASEAPLARAWHRKDTHSSIALEVSGYSECYSSDLDQQQHQLGGKRVYIRDCGPCCIPALCGTIDSEKCSTGRQREVRILEETYLLLPTQQQRCEEQRHPLQRFDIPQQQQQRSTGARTAAGTRKKSYAGQFECVTREKAEKAQPRQGKHSKESQKADSNQTHGPPRASSVKEAPLFAAAWATDTGDVPISMTASPTGNLPNPNASSDAAPVPAASGIRAATGPTSIVDVPGPIYASCTVSAKEAPQPGVYMGQIQSLESPQKNVPPCVATDAVNPELSNRLLARPRYQRMPQRQQNTQHIDRQRLQMLQNEHQKHNSNSRRTEANVKVVNRELKALIEEQLKHAAANPPVVPEGGDHVSCSCDDVTNARNSVDGDRDNGGRRHAFSEKTAVGVAGAATVLPVANEASPVDRTSTTAGNTRSYHGRDSLPATVDSEGLNVDGVSARQQLTSTQEYRSEHKVSLQGENTVQGQAFHSQDQHNVSEPMADFRKCVREDNSRLQRPCKEECPCSDVAETSELVDSENGYTVCETACKLPPVGDISMLCMDEMSPSMQQGGKTAVLKVTEDGEDLRVPSHGDGCVCQVDNAESHAQPFNYAVPRAVTVDQRPASLKRVDSNIYSVQTSHECTNGGHGAHSGRQHRTESMTAQDLPVLSTVQGSAAADGANTQEEQEGSAYANSPLLVSRTACTERLHPSRVRHTPHRSVAGPAAIRGALEYSDSGEDTEVEEGREDEHVDGKKSRTGGIRIPVVGNSKLSSIGQKNSSSVARGKTKATYPEECSSALLAPPSTSLCCGIMCTSPPQRIPSNACACAATASSGKHCQVSCGSHSRRHAVVAIPCATGSSAAQHHLTEGAPAERRLCSARCPSRGKLHERAAAGCFSGKNFGDLRSCKSSNCCSACDTVADVCAEDVSSVKVLRDKHESDVKTAAPSGAAQYPEPREGLRPASFTGLPRGHPGWRSPTESTSPEPQRVDNDIENPEISDAHNRSTRSTSQSPQCSYRKDRTSQGHHEPRRSRCAKDSAVATHEGVGETRCIKSREMCRECNWKSVACANSNRLHDRTSVSYHSTGLSSNSSGSVLEDSCSRNSSGRGSKRSQIHHSRTLSSMRLKSDSMFGLPARTDKKCGCAQFSPRMPATAHSCDQRVPPQGSASTTRRRVGSCCEAYCNRSSDSCLRTPRASRSESNTSTCCGSSRDSLDSSALGCALSRRSSSTMLARVTSGHISRCLRNLPTRTTKKAVSKKCDRNELKFQALTNAEKKVEERLLLLDVNQKTLDEQHERRRYLQQQQLQQQQLLLLEQQQHLQQQQQLLTLAHYGNLQHEDDVCGSPPGIKKTDVSVNTPQGSATAHYLPQTHCNRIQTVPPATQSGGMPSMDFQGRAHLEREFSREGLGRTAHRLLSDVRQTSVPVHGASQAAFPPPAFRTAPAFRAVKVPPLEASTARRKAAPVLLVERRLVPTAPSMASNAPPLACLSSKAESENKLLSVRQRYSQPLPPLKSSMTATAPSRSLRKRPGDAAASSGAIVTDDPVAAGPGKAPDLLHIPRVSPPAAAGCPQRAGRGAAAELPPLRVRTSSWTRGQQPLSLIPSIM